MKYTSLKTDIINILHSSDYDLNIKFYTEDGNTTVNPDEAQWGYINNKNIVIQFMTDSNHTIYIWKDENDLDENLKSICQRMRELAVLNGVSVQIRVYNNLNQRKIYNLIKSSIPTLKENVSMKDNNKLLIESLCSVISSSKNAKKSSDFYMSEAMLNTKTEKLLKEMFQTISSLSNLKKLNLNESLNTLLINNSINDITNYVQSLPEKTLNKLYESIDDIKNISSFVKKKYLNNIETPNVNNLMFVLENVKVYKSQNSSEKNNLINAYNSLIKLTENVNDKIGLYCIIKKNNIEESYNVKRDDLVEFWMENNGQPIKIFDNIIVENYLGEKFVIDGSLSYGIKSLANYFNNGGVKDSIVYNNIINETIKYNTISDFIINYKNDYNIRKFIPKFKKLFNESIYKLNNYSNELFENVNSEIDYSSEYNSLCQELGIEHPALKYVAETQANENALKAKLLFEEENNDAIILVEELKHYSKFSSAMAYNIIRNRLNINLPIMESTNYSLYDKTKFLYESLCNNTDELSLTVSSSLFNILNSKKKTIDEKKTYLDTLFKYC